MGDTPWRLHEEGVLREAEANVPSEARFFKLPSLTYELEWDRDGDAVMR